MAEQVTKQQRVDEVFHSFNRWRW